MAHGRNIAAHLSRVEPANKIDRLKIRIRSGKNCFLTGVKEEKGKKYTPL